MIRRPNLTVSINTCSDPLNCRIERIYIEPNVLSQHRTITSRSNSEGEFNLRFRTDRKSNFAAECFQGYGGGLRRLGFIVAGKNGEYNILHRLLSIENCESCDPMLDKYFVSPSSALLQHPVLEWSRVC